MRRAKRTPSTRQTIMKAPQYHEYNKYGKCTWCGHEKPSLYRAPGQGEAAAVGTTVSPSASCSASARADTDNAAGSASHSAPCSVQAAWIAVEDSLPDDEMTVLIALEDGEVWTGFLDGGEWRYVS